MKRNLEYIFTGILLFALTSCERPGTMGEDEGYVNFVLDTKAAEATQAEKVTFRIMAYNSSSKAYLGDKRNGTSYGYGTGSYYLNEDTGMLAPCTVRDDDGQYVADDVNAGIRGTLGNVLLCYLSPALKNNPDGSFDFNPDNPFYCSPCVSVNVNGYGTVDVKNQIQIQDMRAKVAINFYSSRDDTDFTLKTDNTAVFLRGTGDDGSSVNFNPATKLIATTAEAKGRSCTLTPVSSTTDDKGTLLYKTELFVPAANYGYGLTLDLEMTQGEREVALNALLTSDSRVVELLPMYIYTFNLIVESTYITITADVYKPSGDDVNYWHEVTESTGTEIIGRDIPIGRIPLGWEDKNLDNPSVGPDPSEGA